MYFNIRPDQRPMTAQQILSRILAHGRGWVFTPKAFADLGDPRAAGVVLGRLVAKGKIRRLTQGLYDYPKAHPRIGVLSPDPDAIARALAAVNASGYCSRGLCGQLTSAFRASAGKIVF